MEIDISSTSTEVNASGDNIVVDITATNEVTVEVATSVPLQSVIAQNIAITPTGSITATNLEDAINELANQQFSSASAPTGVYINEGDIWYETDTENLYVYREVSSGVFNWVPIVIGTANSDSLDGGLY